MKNKLSFFFLFAFATLVGSDGLEEWEAEIQEIEPYSIRETLSICSCKTVALFLGGYGEQYEESLHLFAHSLELLPLSNFYVLIQPDPKFSDGSIEESIFSKYSLSYLVIKNEISIKEALAVANFVACHESTGAFQEHAVKKPVIYFIPQSQSNDPLLLQKVRRPEEFLNVWQEVMNQNEAPLESLE